MKRRVVLDTETTGLEVGQGHRIVEIGAVEMLGRRITDATYHVYLNPDRAIDEGAREVTGISDDFLRDKPHFPDVVEAFLGFIDGAELVIHNAPFDVGFLDAELARAGAQWGCIADHATVLDTLVMAREQFPGQRNSLDALCKRLGVDNSRREQHGGLLDAELLAEVYLAMTAGQAALDLGFAGFADVPQDPEQATGERADRPRPRVLRANAEELAAHRARLAALDKECGGQSVWHRLAAEEAAASR